MSPPRASASRWKTEWTRGIEALIEHKGLVFVASIGNGLNASDPSFYPGAGPNVDRRRRRQFRERRGPRDEALAVRPGVPEESSAGPTDDGRCKPDVIAPGNCLVAERPTATTATR